MQCRQKEKYTYSDKLVKGGEGKAEALVDGGAIHAGLAAYFSSRSPEEAEGAIRAKFQKEMEGEMIFPEEEGEIKQQEDLCVECVRAYITHYAKDEFEVLRPEVKFLVPLPNSSHSCIFHPSNATMPHLFTGFTDALVNWNGDPWLMEHKSTKQEVMKEDGAVRRRYLESFLMDRQITGYCYGIWKETGIRPRGVILNVLKKPRINAKEKTKAGFIREFYLRSEDDLLRFEEEFISIAEEIESAYERGAHYRNPRACHDWNYLCPFFQACLRGGVNEGEFERKPPSPSEVEWEKICKEYGGAA